MGTCTVISGSTSSESNLWLSHPYVTRNSFPYMARTHHFDGISKIISKAVGIGANRCFNSAGLDPYCFFYCDLLKLTTARYHLCRLLRVSSVRYSEPRVSTADSYQTSLLGFYLQVGRFMCLDELYHDDYGMSVFRPFMWCSLLLNKLLDAANFGVVDFAFPIATVPQDSPSSLLLLTNYALRIRSPQQVLFRRDLTVGDLSVCYRWSPSTLNDKFIQFECSIFLFEERSRPSPGHSS